MGAKTDTRDRMIAAAKLGFRTNGTAATSFSDVLERAGAARGAIYHHFPGGRRELVTAVIASTADNVAAGLARRGSGTPLDDLTARIDLLCDVVDRADGAFGCAVTPAVLEADGDDVVLDAAHAAFDRWRDALVEEYDLTARTATVVVAAVEGALVLCRAARSSEPLRAVAERLPALIGDG